MGDHLFLAYDYPLMGAFWTAMWIFLWVLWLMLLFRVIADIFHSDDMKGLTKGAWLLFVLVLPYLGVFIYLVARGTNMGARERQQIPTLRDSANGHGAAPGATGPTNGVDDLIRLTQLKARGDLSEREFEQAKEKLLR